MRAVELQAFGIEHLQHVERPDPTPGPGEVLVRMRYASLNYRDLVVAVGGYGSQHRAPLIPLSDGAGEVHSVGAGVRTFAPGDRVMACFFQSWAGGAPTAQTLVSSLGGPLDGVLCELRCLPEQGLCKLPEHLSLAEAASLPCAALTAWNALAVLGRIGPGGCVLVQGTGGVSLFALQFAKLFGARVIVTSSSDEKLTRARALGADETLNYTRTPEWGKAVRELTFGRGVEHVIEVGGAGTLAQSLRAVCVGGTVSLIGVLSGAKNEIHLPHVFLPQVRLQGVVVGSREAAIDMLRAIQAHRMKPVLDERTFTMAQIREALDYLRTAQHFGKISIEI